MTENPSDQRRVAVSERAQLLRCEQDMLFDRQYGQRPMPERVRGARQGRDAHRQHDQQTQRYQGRSADRRCFVATAIYGENAEQTETLRAWRDTMLQPSWLGRFLIGCYYRLSPWLVSILERWPGAPVAGLPGAAHRLPGRPSVIEG